MSWSPSVRSIAIRVTGVCAAVGISCLAGAARGEPLSQHRLASSAPPTVTSFVAALDGPSAVTPDSTQAVREARAVLQAPAIQGYAAAPRRPVFSESILVNPGFTMSLSLARSSGNTHLTGVVRPQSLQ